MLTEEEKQKVDKEVTDIISPIYRSNQTEIGKLVEAFQAGVKYWEKRKVKKERW